MRELLAPRRLAGRRHVGAEQRDRDGVEAAVDRGAPGQEGRRAGDLGGELLEADEAGSHAVDVGVASGGAGRRADEVRVGAGDQGIERGDGVGEGERQGRDRTWRVEPHRDRRHRGGGGGQGHGPRASCVAYTWFFDWAGRAPGESAATAALAGARGLSGDGPRPGRRGREQRAGDHDADGREGDPVAASRARRDEDGWAVRPLHAFPLVGTCARGGARRHPRPVPRSCHVGVGSIGRHGRRPAGRCGADDTHHRLRTAGDVRRRRGGHHHVGQRARRAALRQDPRRGPRQQHPRAHRPGVEPRGARLGGLRHDRVGPAAADAVPGRPRRRHPGHRRGDRQRPARRSRHRWHGRLRPAVGRAVVPRPGPRRHRGLGAARGDARPARQGHGCGDPRGRWRGALPRTSPRAISAAAQRPGWGPTGAARSSRPRRRGSRPCRPASPRWCARRTCLPSWQPKPPSAVTGGAGPGRSATATTRRGASCCGAGSTRSPTTPAGCRSTASSGSARWSSSARGRPRHCVTRPATTPSRVWPTGRCSSSACRTPSTTRPADRTSACSTSTSTGSSR